MASLRKFVGNVAWIDDGNCVEFPATLHVTYLPADPRFCWSLDRWRLTVSLAGDKTYSVAVMADAGLGDLEAAAHRLREAQRKSVRPEKAGA